MKRPEVRMTLSVSCKDLLDRTVQEWDEIQRNFRDKIRMLQSYDSEPPHETFNPNAFVPPETRTNSRHYQAVAANQRISDALEYLNKEIRLQNGSTDAGTKKILDEVKRILLGM